MCLVDYWGKIRTSPDDGKGFENSKIETGLIGKNTMGISQWYRKLIEMSFESTITISNINIFLLSYISNLNIFYNIFKALPLKFVKIKKI